MYRKIKGFTLIELIVCIVILAILISVGFSMCDSYKQKMPKIKMKTTVETQVQEQQSIQPGRNDEKDYRAIVYDNGIEIKRYNVDYYEETKNGYKLYLMYDDEIVIVPKSTIFEER